MTDVEYAKYITEARVYAAKRIEQFDRLNFPDYVPHANRVLKELRDRFPSLDSGLIYGFHAGLLEYEDTFRQKKYTISDNSGDWECSRVLSCLAEHELYLKDPNGWWDRHRDLVGDLIQMTIANIPRAASDPTPFTARVTPNDPRGTAHAIYWKLVKSAETRVDTDVEDKKQKYYSYSRFFHRLLLKLYENAMGHHIWAGWGETGPLKDHHVLDHQILEAYFKDTPFMPLFDLTVSVPFDQETRLAHTHIVGGTGSGKSTLLKTLIANDVGQDVAIIVLDPHKQLAPELSRLNITPFLLVDPAYPPGINLFQVKQHRDQGEGERAFATVVKMVSYLFREGDTVMTGKQLMVLQYLCRLVISLKETRGRPGNLMDLFTFLIDPKSFSDDIARLPPLSRSFFNDFIAGGAEYKNTGAELRYRLHTILSNPVLEKIFAAKRTTFDIKAEMDKASLVVIDADQGYLGDAAPIFGKIFLALIMQAARERGTNAKPAFLYIDEAHRFLDEQAQDLLTDARKYRVGCTFAHQNLAQIPSPEIRGALAGTAVKFAGGVRAEDAASLAADMRTTKEFLLGLPKHHFAMYSGSGSAVSITVDADPLGNFTRLPDGYIHERPEREDAPYASQSPPRSGGMSDEY